jgi:hypothetical protein
MLSVHTDPSRPTRHGARVKHTAHLAAHTGPMVAVGYQGRHRVTSETAQYQTVPAKIAKCAGSAS